MLPILIKRIPDIIIGFSIPLIISLLKKVYDEICMYHYLIKVSSIVDGFWISIHKNYKGEKIIEIISFKHINKIFIKIKIHKYKMGESENSFYLYAGNGIQSGNKISLFYYLNKGSQTGVMTCEIKELSVERVFMCGSYLEIHNTDKTVNNYTAYPLLKLPFIIKIKIFLNKKIFFNNNDFKNFMKRQNYENLYEMWRLL